MKDDPTQRRLALSVVVPCYNEFESVRELYRRVTAPCSAAVGEDYELLLVNDGSTDGTWREIVALSEADARVVGINLARNYGHQLALSAGLQMCTGRRILVMDADLQHPPELLPEMMKLMDEGADIVYGQRASREGDGLFKRMTAATFYWLLQKSTQTPAPANAGDFRLMSRRALDVLNAMPEQHRFLRGMVSWIGLRQVPLVYECQPRFAGKSKYPARKMVGLAVDAITGFSVTPLRIASYVGILFAILAVVFLGYSMYSWLTGQVVRGWTSVMTVVLVLGAVQLLVLGVIGEYVGRTYIQAKQRPLFVVDEMVRSAEASKRVDESQESQ